MKKLPLFTQLLFMFGFILSLLALLLFTTIPGTLRSFFTHEMYTTIEDAQQQWTSQDILKEDSFISKAQAKQDRRTVSHLFLNENGKLLRGSKLPDVIRVEMYEQAIWQNKATERYKGKIENEDIFYVIREISIGAKSVYQVSYMFDSYQQDLVKTLSKRLFFLISIISIACISVAYLFSKRLSKPIIEMEQHVHKMAARNLDTSLLLYRQDELGSLANSIEELRKQLKQKDQAQATMLQYVSHDLKTPVMVIRSYAEAFKDGIYPKGSIEESANVIQKEAERLEGKVGDLLYLSKLEYLNQTAQEKYPVDVDVIIQDVVDRFKTKRDDLVFTLSIRPVQLLAVQEQIQVALENLLDNAIRYADKQVQISLDNSEKQVILRIWNDGEKLTDADLKNMFKAFHKGNNGNFGLGLAIVKRIVDSHRGSIYFKNTDIGVVVEIILPQQ
ncbi:sensor histidine kinase [Bacillus sp. DJP31]|uniref:sensor histidine kinase n=1 Tax=Bacillus sp. DJP31 TaxID=3409789 RepID=UPI003BB5117C